MFSESFGLIVLIILRYDEIARHTPHKFSFCRTYKVAKDADSQTIKKAYRKLAMSHHPDKGTYFVKVGRPEIYNVHTCTGHVCRTIFLVTRCSKI